MAEADRADKSTFFIKTYGCQMNSYDSNRMRDALVADGYRETESPEQADLVLLNTCHIREKAAEKVYSDVGRLRQIKTSRAAEGLQTKIAVAGCVAQAEGEEIIRRAPAVDLVIGPQSYHRLPKLLKSGAQAKVEIDFPEEDKFQVLPDPSARAVRARGATAFLTIQEGCDKFCAFCVVPYTRGAEVSRPVAQIEQEARMLAASGVREITLLGQNVNAWHGIGPEGDEWGLGHLLYHLDAIPGLDRLRYTTSHPNDMDDMLIHAHGDLPSLMPYLHLPVQSGSDQILHAMNRRHTRDDYFRLIDRIRGARPDLALSGDFIVGFPGETDKDFADTMDLIECVEYAQAYSFKYSPRPGTPAADASEMVPAEVASARLQELQGLIKTQQKRFNTACIGRSMSVLLEKPGRNPGQLVGRSPWLQAVQVDAPATLQGEICDVVISAAGNNSLFGDLQSNKTSSADISSHLENASDRH